MVYTEQGVCSGCKGELTPTPLNSQYDVLLCMNVHCIKYANPQGNVLTFRPPDVPEPSHKAPAEKIIVRSAGETTSDFIDRADKNLVDISQKPICTSCGKPFDAGLKKNGEPAKEKKCWICSGWSEEYRVNRQVYDESGKPIFVTFAKGRELR